MLFDYRRRYQNYGLFQNEVWWGGLIEMYWRANPWYIFMSKSPGILNLKTFSHHFFKKFWSDESGWVDE